METLNIIMWILVIIMLLGMILTYRNINGDKILSKYEGLWIILLSLLASSSIGIYSSKSLKDCFGL